MANSQNFRSSFNGFNREDVVHYLEYLNSKHSALVNQLSEEAENLRQKLSVAAEAISSDSSRAERITALEAERDELKQLLEVSEAARAALEAECEMLKDRVDAAPAADSAEVESLRAQLAREQEKCARLEAELQTKSAVSSSTAEKELEAYRRAERLERIARERADQIYRRTNGILADATVKVDQVACDVGSVADRVMEQLQQLQQTVAGSKQALQDAAAVMYAIRPEGEEE